jgi:hypothetical protein
MERTGKMVKEIVLFPSMLQIETLRFLEINPYNTGSMLMVPLLSQIWPKQYFQVPYNTIIYLYQE